MRFLVLDKCDLVNRQNSHTPIMVHDLSHLNSTDEYIPRKPHRHSFYQILYVQNGSGVHKIDFVDHKFGDETIFFLYPGQVHVCSIHSATPEGIMINFSEEFYNTFLLESNFLDRFPFFDRIQNISLLQLNSGADQIKALLHSIKNESRKPVLRLKVLQLLYECTEHFGNAESESAHDLAGAKLKEFDALIEDQFELEHYPRHYAEKLNISPNYLNAICKEKRGKTAGEIIRNRISLEAKRLLVNSKIDISEIAFLLGFEDNSYFTKFFKSQTGQTPRQFRNSL